MSTESNPGYMLIFRGSDWHKGLSPEEAQRVIGEWMEWFQRLSDKGTVTSGKPLEPEGKVVSGKGGKVVADGPFAESKEAVGGFFILNVNSMDEAVAIAKQCPGLPYGAKVEVRPLASECPGVKAAEERLAHAS